MKPLIKILPLLLILLLASAANAQSAKDSTALTALLNEFLDGAGRNDADIHDRFWAEDLIYTRGSGQRTNKAEIMKSVRSAPQPKPDDPKMAYSAEDIIIRQYGNTAIVSFRLVGTTNRTNSPSQTVKFYNTGTFIKQKGRWQAAAWQATPIPTEPQK